MNSNATRIQIGKRTIGDGHPCFITFEAGPIHTGLESAKKLVELAAKAGGDAVKFQILDPDRLVADKKQMFGYDVLLDRKTGATKTVQEPLYDLLKRRSLQKEEWLALKAHADSLGLAFFATIGYPDEVELVARMGCDSIKIASGDVNHHPLIREAAKTGLVIQLDTGNSTLGEIEQAIDVCLAEGNDRILIHQCPSGYPARVESINLRIIQTLKTMFGFPVAYSDHSPGWEMDIAAVALGANLVEKTLTFDRTTPSVEHLFSLEPPELFQFVQVIRDLEKAMGNSRRVIHQAEIPKRNSVRRSAYLARDVKAGDRVGAQDIEWRRPGHGIAPNLFPQLEGLVYRADLPKSHLLSFSDLKPAK
ncbi:MAG: N-acetylneuraminate synthase family protein [Verrucomicrobiae bacterium]|nr:N-acetylneuraminate synthase family protein [Verrucomicrobiae bacterium]